MSYALWRQDDHGNRWLVGRFERRADAEERMAALCRVLHKQSYFVAAEEDCRQEPGE